MELKEFIPILECALKCSDEVSLRFLKIPQMTMKFVFSWMMVREVAVLPLELEMHLY